jgi:F-type H+-transporting ATPase subunit alpha
VKSIKKVSGTLKLELAQYRSLEAFAMFASDLDAASRQQLTRGARLMELLKQPQYSPYPVAEQVASIWAGTHGKLDGVALSDVRRFESELLDHLRRNTSVLTTIRDTGDLTAEVEADMAKAIDEFAVGFMADQDATEEPLMPQDTEPPADEQQETIVKRSRG